MNTLIEKNFDIEAPIELVWKSLANPEEIVGCVPGASITEKIDDRNYKGAVVTKFGPIKASYAGDIEIVELEGLQGVTGLKAIRAEILYRKDAKSEKTYTYADLMEELKS